MLFSQLNTFINSSLPVFFSLLSELLKETKLVDKPVMQNEKTVTVMYSAHFMN